VARAAAVPVTFPLVTRWWAFWIGAALAAWLMFFAAGCSLTVGGAKFCFLDHADLTVTTHHEHVDPNASH